MADRKITAILELDDRMSGALDRAGNVAHNFGRALGTAALAGGAALGALGAYALKAGMDFEQSMANVHAVTGASVSDMQQMSAAALDMSKRYAGSAKDAADGLYYIASAGYSAKDSMGALQGVMALSSATQSDLASTSENVMAAISMFGMRAYETGRIADVYAKACAMSQAEMSKLSDSMRYAGPVAKTLGWNIEQTTAILSKLYDAGYKGEQAGTGLRMALSRLINPTKEVADALDGAGISSDELATAIQAPDTLIKLFTDHSITAQQALEIFSTEAGPQMLALLGQGSAGITEYISKLNAAGGTAQTMADIQLNTLQGALERVRDSFVALTTGVGTMDGLKNMLKDVSGLIDALASGDTEKAGLYGANVGRAIGGGIASAGAFISDVVSGLLKP